MLMGQASSSGDSQWSSTGCQRQRDSLCPWVGALAPGRATATGANEWFTARERMADSLRLGWAADDEGAGAEEGVVERNNVDEGGNRVSIGVRGTCLALRATTRPRPRRTRIPRSALFRP